MKRKCKKCPEWTQTVCRFAFGAYWCVKSLDGEGCANPLDGVAEAWRKAGWTPDCKAKVALVVQDGVVSKRPVQSFTQPELPKKEELTDEDY